jgi:flagellar assembly protein FliH
MSSFWSPDDIGDATRITGFGALGKRPNSGGFLSRYGSAGDGTGWTAARAQTADRLDAEPEIDPVEQASRDGFVAGFQEGERVTREAMEADDAARIHLAEAIEQLAGAGSGALSAMLSHAVLRLVTQVVGEVAVDEAKLAERCAAIAACIDPDDSRAVLEVNPDDLPLIDASAIGVTLTASPAIPRGSVRLATADGWIEDGPDVRLARLKALMDDMEGRL